jgi:serine O-acetyltransferase
MTDLFLETLFKKHQSCTICPPSDKVIGFYDDLIGLLFPDLSVYKFESIEKFKYLAKKSEQDLWSILQHDSELKTDIIESKCKAFFDKVPDLERMLQEDAVAMFNGDPAAKSSQEVIRSYPGFKAIAAYRIAHALYSLDIKLVPRMISEVVHSRTGIDIHPGAIIGRSFCVDHGTGVVIGQTCIIGDNVKIYQGVTLGALSVKKEDAKIKRHPTIEDGVIIYAGATILGGETVIGKHTIIGGNVWITESVPANSKIYYNQKNHS